MVMRKLLLVISLLTAVGLVAAGYAGYINPARHPMLSLLGFAFPFFLVADIVVLLIAGLMRSRVAVVPLLALLAAWPPTKAYCPVNLPMNPPPNSIKVLTYNVMGFDSEHQPSDRPNPILKYICDQEADIVCLQEFVAIGGQDSLWEAMHSHLPYMAASRTLGYARVGSGDHVALFSRYPIIACHAFALDTQGNTLAVFRIVVGKDTVCVFNGHLETNGLSVADKQRFETLAAGKTRGAAAGHEALAFARKLAEAARVRAPQADSIALWTAKRMSRGDAIIVCGDLNDHPLSYARRRAASGLTDCYRETGLGPGFTFHHHSMHFRIDNIFCSDRYRPYLCTVDRSITLSDHYPMLCWLERK